MKKWFMAGAVALAALVLPDQADASSEQYTVKSGDTLWNISQQYGTTVDQLKANNGLTDDLIYPGQTLTVGEAVINEGELDLLSRLVHAEAEGESYEGKAAVAAVVLNRVESSEFPDTVEGVIYETHGSGGIFAFEPVQNGQINKLADQESINAARDAMNGYDPSNGALFFFNPETSTSEWVNRLTIDSQIGNHVFASN
ncbi:MULTISPECIES: cell wall hydrolase [Alteribacter]|uniref:LysM peptidoglycan-binding domain-containing protein n=1 Tax=Alteribacter keqinensis TaxID=2483800 RepID=A0A3M7TXT0_9BACI|nr:MULTISPECIES: cell wall hydrolase [Alteribacter]MBM7094552.1 cell wall hydrolase [Alteribacter salitolerans]RNA69235.1 LysM peptidoglycan-binding domain-containing protein [Alteribacter keqinensis]